MLENEDMRQKFEKETEEKEKKRKEDEEFLEKINEEDKLQKELDDKDLEEKISDIKAKEEEDMIRKATEIGRRSSDDNLPNSKDQIDFRPFTMAKQKTPTKSIFSEQEEDIRNN